ncbi:CBS domain-containing protein [Nocardia farcinica]|uniref:CBS domain-containing protein n=1 Tax=Nocardia farcinica TaxID=37329 RepID=UPI00189575D3|nr:CBS domain-containing protein [Nocardia farcinica]MBF6231831.1 CBS domain-containing protein [Nocardia farcinica]MBF6260176.1 CBS domain-containing protein [Nocardia farcinica]MBF6420727.1 CBS domain-containing protein [Nocardia farcinica]MBF6431971.1 CBS domain-containing protein [Nocardia farcinica]MBF6502681.1 CBS domain-containing protein [Nocardia farcinica]
MTVAPPQQDVRALLNTSIPVADLLEYFGFRTRNYDTVPVITKALQAAGLTTTPSFATCRRDARVMIVAADDAPNQPIEDPEGDQFLPGTLPQRPFLVGDLPAARGRLISVTSDVSLTKAVHLMRSHDISQIPVIDGSSDLKGVVTWQSVAALREKPHVTPTLAAATVGTVDSAETHHELFPRLPIIQKQGFLLVRERTGEFSGIITTADVTAHFHQSALPFFLIGEIEGKLRKLLGSLSPQAIALVQTGRNKTGDIHDLMFGQYELLLRTNHTKEELRASADANWQRLGWTTVDRTLFVAQLGRVRAIRNAIAHFSPKQLPESDLDELRSFAQLLNHLL